jgi:hypothetical protein
MLRVVIAADSFKGSLSAPEVCAALGRGLARAIPALELRLRPMADGGEGTLDAILAAIGDPGQRKTADVRGAGGAKVAAAYGLVPHPDGLTAVVEVAQVVGITDITGDDDTDRRSFHARRWRPDQSVARRGRAPLHDRTGRQQHQRRRQRRARARLGSRSSTTAGCAARRHRTD